MGDSLEHLQWAKDQLAQHWTLIAESRVYRSAAVDYTSQPDFLNQVLQFALPWQKPDTVMKILLEIEKERGRERHVLRGPRTIDIDIIFWGLESIKSEVLTAPHPRWDERSFVVRPLSELPFWHALEKCFTIPKSFSTEAYPL